MKKSPAASREINFTLSFYNIEKDFELNMPVKEQYAKFLLKQADTIEKYVNNFYHKFYY